MTSYINFSSCKEQLTDYYQNFKNQCTANTKLLYDVYTNKIVQKVLNIGKEGLSNNFDTVDELVQFVIKHSNLKKITIDVYDEKKENPNINFDNLINDEKYDNPEYLYHYQKEKNKDKPLSHTQLFFLCTKIMPVHSYLSTAINELFQSLYEMAKLLDCFIDIKGAPKFFETYFTQLGISGIQLIDVEIILAFASNILLFDSIDELKSVYSTTGNNKGKIIKVNNIFDIFFKWKHIDFSTVFNSSILGTFVQKVKTKVNVDKIVKRLFKGFYAKERDECIELYESGAMSISVYLAYFLKNLKNNTTVLSFSNLGYLDDLITRVITSANQQKNQLQQGGDTILFPTLFAVLRAFGVFTLLINLLSTLKKPTIKCVRAYYSKKTLDMSKNLSFAELVENINLDKEVDNMLINIITQKKYKFLAHLILTFSFNKHITPYDKKLISPAIFKNKSKTKSNPETLNDKEIDDKIKMLSQVYTASYKLTKISILQTGLVSLDIIYLLFTNKKSTFKVYDSILTNFFDINDYEVKDEFNYLILIINNFFNKLSGFSVKILRQKLICYLVIQNLFLLGINYYSAKKGYIQDKKVFVAHLLLLCEKIGDMISKTSLENLDTINELILACLGENNSLFSKSIIELLSNLVDYNFLAYREYIATAKIVMINKSILFSNITKKNDTPTQQQAIEPEIKEEEEETIIESANPNPPSLITRFTNLFMSYVTPTPSQINNMSNEIINEARTESKKASSSVKGSSPVADVESVVEHEIDTYLNELNTEQVSFKETIRVRKEKIELFIQKLIEYSLYISMPLLENSLQISTTNGVLNCKETELLMNHLKSPDTNLLFETKKQKELIKFLAYF